MVFTIHPFSNSSFFFPSFFFYIGMCTNSQTILADIPITDMILKQLCQDEYLKSDGLDLIDIDEFKLVFTRPLLAITATS